MPVRLDSISTNVSTTAKCFHHTSTISALLVIKCKHPMVPLFVLVQLKIGGLWNSDNLGKAGHSTWDTQAT